MDQIEATPSPAQIVETEIPARLDRLPWGPFHTMVVIALGVTWILDGLEVTLVGAIGGALKQEQMLALTNFQVGLAGSAYLGGAVMGALLFGWLTDIFGRQKLFSSPSAFICWRRRLRRCLGISPASLFSGRWSGPGSAANTRQSIRRFRTDSRPCARPTDIVINGSFWIGAGFGALGTLVLLDSALVAPAYGWRVAFLIGALLGLPIFSALLHPGKPALAGDAWPGRRGGSGDGAHRGAFPAGPQDRGGLKKLRLRRRSHTPLPEVFATLFRVYPLLTFVGVSLVAAQAFLYNAVFFTYALTLGDFYGVSPRDSSWHLLALAVGNFVGPLALGRLFDTVGRKPMIASTYAISGLLILCVGALFALDLLTAAQQTAGWMLTFFFASAAACSAYLTVSEIFPLEMRALAIALFYAFGTLLGGISGPLLFGALVASGERGAVFGGYALSAILMIAAAIVEWRYGIAAERQPLEAVAPPLTALDRGRARSVTSVQRTRSSLLFFAHIRI